TTPPTWAVPIAVRTLCWLNTRSTATTSGRCSASQCSTVSATSTSLAPRSSSGGVRTTSTATQLTTRPAPPSTTPSPQRVSPGSTPSTRTAPPRHPTNTRSKPSAEPAHRSAPTHADVLKAADSADLGKHVVGDVEVSENVLHVVAVFQGL